MRVIVAGSTSWDNEAAIRNELSVLPSDTVVVYGDAPGADAIGGAIAHELGLKVESFAKNAEDYKRYKRGAWKGLNERMLASRIDLILAFHADVDKSTGTKHLLRLAEDVGVSIKIVN